MREQRFREGGNLLAVYKTFFFDLPLAAMRETFAAANGREAVEAAWKNYDQGIRLATAAIDNLYRDPRFGRVVDRALQGVLRWQQLSSSVSGALLPGRRPTVDLPTAAEVRELLTELRALSSRYSRVPEGAATDGQLPPVNVPRKGANAVPSPEQRSRGYLTADLGDYFEPVDGGGGATAADSPPALRRNRLSIVPRRVHEGRGTFLPRAGVPHGLRLAPHGVDVHEAPPGLCLGGRTGGVVHRLKVFVPLSRRRR